MRTAPSLCLLGTLAAFALLAPDLLRVVTAPPADPACAEVHRLGVERDLCREEWRAAEERGDVEEARRLEGEYRRLTRRAMRAAWESVPPAERVVSPYRH